MGGAATALVTSSGGLGRLQPETSVAKSVSVVLTPNEFMPEGTNVSIAVDYYEIEVAGEITQLGAFNILSGCYGSDFFPNDPLCSLFVRGDLGDPLTVATVTDDFINISQQENRGIDVTARLRQELPNGWGDVSILAQMSWQFEDDVALFPGTNLSVNGEDGEPIWVGNFHIEWTKGEWSAFWGIDAVQHTSDIDDFRRHNNGQTCLPNFVYGTACADLIAESNVRHSVSVTREFDDWSITLGVANLFDEPPPRVSTLNRSEITTIGQAPFTSNYDYVGRRGFLSVSKKF